MATLYEINQAILNCIDFETGELINPEQLEQLQMEKSQKIENIVLWIKNLESDALAFKAEKEAFEKREKSAKAKAEQLKNYLTFALKGDEFSTTKCFVKFRYSESVEVLDENKIPKKLMIKTVSFKPDKKTIKEFLKEGKKVNGCCLLSKINPQIK